MSKKFEQLIEFVINDDEQKARELFHEIVVEKSREIYESLMADEFSDGGDLANSVEADEEGFDDSAEGFDEFGSEEDSEFGDAESPEDAVEELEDRVVDLEDKLDELMAEFDALMADEEGADEFGDEEGADEFGDEEAVDFGDEEFGDEEAVDFGDEGDEFQEGLHEEVKLTPVPKPSNADTADNRKSVGLQNSGKGGVKAGGNPIKTDTTAEAGRSAPSSKQMGVAGPQDAAKGAFKSKAPASAKAEPAGTDKQSIVRK